MTKEKANSKNPCNLRKKSAAYRKKDTERIFKQLKELLRASRMLYFNISRIIENKNFSYDKFKEFLEPFERADCLAEFGIDESKADDYEYEITEAVHREFRRLFGLMTSLEKAIHDADEAITWQNAEYVTDEWSVKIDNKHHKCPMEYPEVVNTYIYRKD